MTLAGSNVVITGASSGLGMAVSQRFAELGACTILVCRTPESCEATALEIQKREPDARLDTRVCDLASLASTNCLIADLSTEYAAIDLLFNNAGVMKRDRTVTEDGFETMFQVNYLAPFMLMTSLLEPLRKSTTSLVLNNGRPSAKLRLDLDDLQASNHYRMYNSFFRTKLCLLLATLELAMRTEAAGVSIVMADPGPFKSGLVREAPWPVGSLKNLFSASVDTAADNIFYVATSDAAQKTGTVFKKRQEFPLATYWKDEEVRKQLWSATETMLQSHTSG